MHESLTGILGDARQGHAIGVIALLLVYYPFAVILVQDVRAFVYGAGLERQDVESLMDVVAYVDDHTAPADVVLSTSHISRLVSAQGTELYQGLAAEGVTVSYFGEKLPESRFVYNSSYRGARFVVLHNQTLAWLAEKQSLGDVSAELGTWPIVYRSGRYVVYANPYKRTPL